MTPGGRAAGAIASCSVDLACFTLEGRRIMRLELERADQPPAMPWAPLAPGAGLGAAATSLMRRSLGGDAAWMTQLGAYDASQAHASGLPLTVAYVAVVPIATIAPDGSTWRPAAEPGGLDERQRRIAADALALLRQRSSIEPIPFHLLPPRFTLSQLQAAYEVLLRRRLHKASFRRALQSAALIVETDEHRSSGRGRPARLYRYAPRRTSRRRPSLPFDAPR